MRLTTAVVALLFAALISGCASSLDEVPAGVTPPRIIVGTLEVPHMEATTMALMSVIVRIQVTNTDDEPLVVERLEITSVGRGPYELGRGERRYQKELAPGTTEVFDLVVPAQAMDRAQAVGGQEGAMQIRVIGYFNSSVGRFRMMDMQSVATSYSTSEGGVPGAS